MKRATTNAWLLRTDSGARVAIGGRNLLHVLPDTPEPHRIPLAPAHLAWVIVWQGRLLPLADLSGFDAAVDREDPGNARNALLVGVTAFVAGETDAPGLGALGFRGIPEQVTVSDEQACELSADRASWRPVAVSCFMHPEHGAVPILDLRALFRRGQLPAIETLLDPA